MKRMFSIALLLAMSLSLAACGGGTEKGSSSSGTAPVSSGTGGGKDYAGQTVVVQVWGGTYEETFKKYAAPIFEERTGATIEYVIGSTPIAQLGSEGDHPSVDLIHGDAAEVVRGTEMDLFETIDQSKLENAPDLYPQAWEYPNAVVTNWGTYGIAYRTDLVDSAPTKWFDLWDAKYAGGKIGIMDLGMGGALEMADIVARTQGFECADQENWDNLFAKLAELKPNIGILGAQHADVESMLEQGDIMMCVETNGRAISMMQSGLPVGFCMPEEGVPAMTSYIAITKHAPNKELAYILADILLSPEVQKAYAENNFYAPSNGKTDIPQELRSFMPYGEEQVSKLVYIDAAAVEAVKPEFTERWNKIYK